MVVTSTWWIVAFLRSASSYTSGMEIDCMFDIQLLKKNATWLNYTVDDEMSLGVVGVCVYPMLPFLCPHDKPLRDHHHAPIYNRQNDVFRDTKSLYWEQLSYSIFNQHCTKSTIHQVATMLATSKNVLFPGHNHLLTTGIGGYLVDSNFLCSVNSPWVTKIVR